MMVQSTNIYWKSRPMLVKKTNIAKELKENQTVEWVVHMATWAMVRFGFGVKRPESLMTRGGWENWGTQWMNGMSLKRGKGDCRRRELNCLKAAMRNEITNTWDVREWEGGGGGHILVEQPRLHFRSEVKGEMCVCWLACLFLHMLVLRHRVTVAAPNSYWPSKGPSGKAFSDLLKEAFPWSRPKEVTFCLNHLAPSALSPQITEILKATFSELPKLI